MTDAALLARLIEGGVSTALVADVALALASRAVPERSTNADRQARYRARKASPTVTNRNDVTPALHPTERNETVTSRNETVTSVTPLARVDPSITNLVDLSIERKEREVALPLPPTPKPSTSKRGTRIVEGWRPSEAGILFARRQGLPDANVEKEITKMVNHFKAKAGKDGVKLDWDATWQNWVLKACEYGGFAPPVAAAPSVTDDDYRPFPGAPSSAEIRASMKAREKADGGRLSEDHKPSDEAILREGPHLHSSNGQGVPGQARHGGMEPLGRILPRLGLRALPNENGPMEAAGNHDNAGAMAGVVRHGLG